MKSERSEFQCVDQGRFKVTGDLTFSSVASVWGQAEKILPDLEETDFEIDIGAAQKLDSSGLALLVAWSRWAYCNKKELSFSNGSSKVHKLIEINKLQGLLKLT